MEWYETIFELIDMRSFSNLWFWIALAVMWSSASHFVLGVPFDMVARARRHGGQAETDLQDMVRINVDRMLYIVRTAGSWLLAFACFLLTMLGTLGFWYGIEFAQALFCLVTPMTLVAVLTLRAGQRIERQIPEGPPLHRMLTRHRMLVQSIGMVSIFLTSMWGMWQNLQIGAL